MKKAILLSFLVALVSFGTFAQTNYDTIKVTYTLGDIGTSHLFRYDGDTSPCPGYMNVPVPNNAIVTTVDVSYQMTASSPQRKSDQRSQLWCTSPGGKKESQVYKGSGYSPGTTIYNRIGLDVAFGIKPIFDLGVDFQLHAGSYNYYAADTCSTEFNKVDDSTWTLTVVYLPPGSPDFASNPTPNDGAQLVSLLPTLTWDFGANTKNYDLYFGTDNPPMTKVVDNALAIGTTGSYSPAKLLESTEYYWRVVPRNDMNETPGVVWSFKTKCAIPDYPYLENFDGVTPPALPDCWIGLSNHEYNYVRTKYSSSNSHSSPNYVEFSSQATGTPEMVLVLPKVDNVKDMYLTFWGKNSTNWTTGIPYEFPFEIGTIQDPFDYTTFEAFKTIVPGDEYGHYTYHEVYFNNYTGTNEYLAIRAAVPQYGVLYLDDVTVDLIPSCVKPLDLQLDSVTTSSVTVSWTDLISTPGKWEIEVDTLGAVFGSGTRVEVTSNPATVTGLADGAYYNVYARAICGVGDTSEWSLPLTILTECLPKELPLVEDFGVRPPYPLKPTLPVCWSMIDQCSAQYGGIFLETYNARTGIGITFAPENDTNAQLFLISPAIGPALGTVQVSFYAARSKNGGEKGLIVGTMSDPTDPATFNPYDTLDLMPDYQYYTVYFINYTGTDTYIAWKQNSKESPVYDAYLDDIEIKEMASCIVPTEIAIEEVYQTSFNISWVDINNANTWEILVGDPGFVPETDPGTSYYYTDPAASGNESTLVKGLEEGKRYDVYMRTLCSSTDYSDWEGPISLSTSLPMHDLPAVEDFENGMGMTANAGGNNVDWELDTNLYVSADHSIHNAYGSDNNNSLIFGSFDLAGKTNAYLSFYHICKLDGGYDHGYVEISVDGGHTYKPLQASVYKGKGVYTSNYYTDGVPVFNEDSYSSDWGKYNEVPTNDWWKKEYFDLSAYAGYSNVSIRFRVKSNHYKNKKGWWIDDLKVVAMEAPVVSTDPTAIDETIMEDVQKEVELSLLNSGGFPATYKVKVVYDEQDLLAENFDNGIPDTWTSIAQGTLDSTWRSAVAYQTYYSFDGTKFAMCSGTKPTEVVDSITDGVLLTPVIDASQYKGKGLRLEFDQAFQDYYKPGDTARVYVYDGTQWVMIYEHYGNSDGRLSYNSNGVHKAYDVAMYANANFQIKFRYIVGSGEKGYFYAIDNFRLRASEFPLGWLTVDGEECVAGINYPDADNVPTIHTVKLDPTGLPYDTFNAQLAVVTGADAKDEIMIPVSMTVEGIPYNVTLVMDDESGNPLDGVTVALGTDTVMTGADGVAAFAGYVSGEYNYCAKKHGYGKITGTVKVDHADYADTLTMLDAYKLYFWFTHEGVALEGVEVTVGGKTITADMDGFAMFEDLIPGDYDYTASLEGYMTLTGTVPIINGDVNVIIEMAREPHDVTFICMDNGVPVEGVAVILDGETYLSNENGKVIFTSKFPGVYSYTAEKDGYVPVYGTVEVADTDVVVNVNMEMITYSVSFYCLDNGNPVEGADVNLNGVKAVSDANGLAFFDSLVPGSYIFTATKEGYFINFGSVTIVDMDVDYNINMTPIAYTFTFNVNDGYSAVEGAVVEFNGESRITDDNGVAMFADVAPGIYTYTVSIDGNVAYESTVEASDLVSEQGFNDNVDVNVTMSITGIINGSGADVAIYPVPSKDVVNIDNAQDAVMRLVDLSGKTVLTKEIETNHSTINVSSLPAGVYFIYLNNSDKVSTHKIIVTK
jgi:hypothetical protein